MRKRLKVIIIVVVWAISVVVAYGAGSLFSALDYSFKPVVYSHRIKSSSSENAIFLKKRVWGLLGNHQKIFLTKSAERDFPDAGEDFVFDNAETLFYKIEQDTLHIFSRRSYDVDFYKGTAVKSVELTNPQFMDLYDEYEASLRCTDYM